MQRDLAKHAFPGYFEATAGGSALKGENKLDCAKRELLEETGITALSVDEIGRCVDNNTIYFVFLCTTDCDKQSVILQEGETISFKWISQSEFVAFANSGNMIPTQKKRYVRYIESIQ